MRIGYPRGKAVLLIMIALALVTTGGPAQAKVPAPGTDRVVAPSAGIADTRRTGTVDRWRAQLREARSHPRSVRADGSRVRVPTAGGMAIDDQNRTMYAVDLDGERLLVIDLRGCTARRQHCRPPVAAISLGARAEELVLDPATHTIYASLPDAAAVAVVDGRRC